MIVCNSYFRDNSEQSSDSPKLEPSSCSSSECDICHECFCLAVAQQKPSSLYPKMAVYLISPFIDNDNKEVES